MFSIPRYELPAEEHKKRSELNVKAGDEFKSSVKDFPEELLENEEDPQIMTAVSCYVKAYLGDDRTDTEKYLDLYRKKVFRLTLEGEHVE